MSELFFSDPVALGAHGTHDELANAFIEFCLSREGQRLLLLKKGLPGGPVDHPLGRLPVRPDTYSEIPVAERTRDEEPFSQIDSGPFVYDSALAQSRWKLVTKILGAIAVDLNEELERYRYVLRGDLNNVPAPISETDIGRYTNNRSAGNLDLEIEVKVLELKNAFRDKLSKPVLLEIDNSNSYKELNE